MSSVPLAHRPGCSLLSGRKCNCQVEKPITDMYLQCMLRVRNFGEPGCAASDCCQKHAVSAVEREDGKRSWRCEAHTGIVSEKPGQDQVRGRITWSLWERA